MNSLSETPQFKKPEHFLSQGDIYKYPIVAPIGDTETRLFRSIDAKHGSWVFETGAPCKAFGVDDLTAVLKLYPEDELRTKPFQKTHDNQSEMTIVYSDLIHYFVIASQTCDIAGQEKEQHFLSTILPLTTIKEF
jgi:hypothetical protein